MIVSYFSIIMFCSWSLYIDFRSASLQGEKYSRYGRKGTHMVHHGG